MSGSGRRAAIAAVRRIRHDPDFTVAEDIATKDFLIEVVERARSVFRAQWALRGVVGHRIRFAERDVRVQFRSHCTIGSGSVVEQGAILRGLSRDGIRIGSGVTIGKYAILECSGSLGQLAKGITIGDSSSVGDYSYIGAAGGVFIGARVLMGQKVSLHSQNHVFDDPDRPIQVQGTTEVGIVIEDDCWIGAGTIILDGVTVGHGSVLSAGTVITKDVPAGSVVAGVPGRVVRSRW
ncbi:acyltransferase [Aeromicrobium sp.]|uniref:acyltransferase n=1 Tax=Aeromicrobium sp. TaxID=1871063 RepID=UPI0019C653F8|nr:acyltransferase [Aeromicrobium sp.]MBC7630447.1 acyltransferase [Aeromicrobium sp.]